VQLGGSDARARAESGDLRKNDNCVGHRGVNFGASIELMGAVHFGAFFGYKTARPINE
jgi:hypothetical protein